MASAAGWLRGTVKEVVSGDTLVIVGAVRPGAGPPPEKRLTLSSIMTPKLGKRDGSSRDEPHAWPAREFLRTKAIGQTVVFKVDYSVDVITRDFGSVFLGQENLGVSVVKAGYAKVRGGDKQSPYIEDLKKAELEAQVAGVALWSKDSEASLATVRPVSSAEGFNAVAYLASVGGKGTVVSAIVDQVVNGGHLRLTLLPSNQPATVVLCGVQAPSMGRKAAAPVDGEEGSTPAPISAASIAAQSNSEPFAREAKYLTEMRALNREVRVVLEGIDKYENLFATVFVPPAPVPVALPGQQAAPAPATNGHATEEDSLAELLSKAGYAKCVEWSMGMMTSGAQKLREIERQAKLDHKGMWANWVAPVSNQTKLSDTFTGKVAEIVSGDCLVIKDTTSGVERRVQLSSLRAPRMGARDRAADPWATDAKEFLRKKLIGREVEVKMEYTRKVPVGGEGSGEERVLAFGNVEMTPEKGEEKINVGEMVVARGYASVIKHRSDEERSGVYEQLLECEALGRSAKRGLHSGKEPAANRINDVSLPGSAQKAKQYLPFFQRSGKMQGVVEYVLSGHRLKVTIPKEGTTIVFAPSGIKTPSRAQPASHGKPAVQGEPFADDALAMTRDMALQRDCEVFVETMDRGGTFLGSITILPSGQGGPRVNLAMVLMKAGLARLQPTIDPSRLTDGSALLDAQSAAKAARAKIWQNWTPEMDKVENDEEGEDGAGLSSSGQRQYEVMDVVVTEIVEATEFYVQRPSEPRVQWVMEQLQAVALAEGPAIPPELKPGQLCVAQYSLDKQWYRAYVEKAMPLANQYEVYFMDFGNRERVAEKSVRIMDAALAAVPPQAIQCELAYVKVPSGSQEHAADARSMLSQVLSGGQVLTCTVISREKAGAKDNAKHPRWAHGKCKVTLTDPSNQADLAVELLCAGMARLPSVKRVRDPVTRAAITALVPHQDEAHEARRGIFQFGDPGDSEDEEQAGARPAAAWGKK